MADSPQECTLQLEDYIECLHNKKEKARAKAIKAEELRQIKKRREEEAAARKYTDSAAKSNVARLGIVDDAQKTTPTN
ncbi:12919_t:CDS:2 [Acaulospora morrowiae]|uniref:12919_t:CDS:1 n=1 Tax=Acaulospora morrowiae TaxID=94023 RepID=A0A9N8Z7E7_9GLOM|nr:12919_t:CDS:2 [Acaulospora morrowiae]